MLDLTGDGALIKTGAAVICTSDLNDIRENPFGIALPVVIGHEASGVVAGVGEKVEGFVPAFKVNAVDTVAAGDAFNGGLALALARGQPLPEAVRFANACGALNTIALGARNGMRSEAEVRKFMDSTAIY